MIDIAGTAETLPLLATNTTLTSMGIVSDNSSILSTQNMMTQGAFALLGPLIQEWWPTREEVQLYVFDEIEKAFNAHHQTPQHSSGYGIASATVPGYTAIMPGSGPTEIPQWTEIDKLCRPVQAPTQISDISEDESIDLDGTMREFEPIQAWAMSPALPYLI
jgi:hypothetical protein